jgi:hypothetical protein
VTFGLSSWAIRVAQWNDRRVRIPVEFIQRATLFDSVPIGFLRGLRFPPALHYKSPNIVYRAVMSEVDAGLLIQYYLDKIIGLAQISAQQICT